MSNKVEGQSSGDVVNIHGTTLIEGIEGKYEFSLIKCNKGGYITVRGGDVGAYPNIDDALEYLCRDIKSVMNEPATNYRGAPFPPPPPVHGIETVRRDLGEFHRRPVPKGMAVVANDERRWSYGEILGLATIIVLSMIMGFQGFRLWWPELL